MRKFAFILMGEEFDPETHRACFDCGDRKTFIYTVRDFGQARGLITKLAKDGVGAFELCGAFSPAMCAELIELTDHQIPIGYITHFEGQEDLVARFFR